MSLFVYDTQFNKFQAQFTQVKSIFNRYLREAMMQLGLQ